MSRNSRNSGPIAPDVIDLTADPVQTSRTVSRPQLFRGLIRTGRPRQWSKNALVFAAAFAASSLRDSSTLGRVSIMTVAFCLVASGTYFLNDAADAVADRLHPSKRHRPVAAGVVPVPGARVVGVMLMAGGLGLATKVNATSTAVLGIYAVLTITYSMWLKEFPVIDIVAVASGFLLRAIGGAAAAEVPVSGPFLLLSSFGALFLVVGKREGERLALGEGAVAHRASLAAYTTAFTAQLLSLALTATVLSYASWAFETDAGEPGIPWVALSVVPFVIAMLRATQLVLSGKGADPEELFLHDRMILLAGSSTVMLLAIALYIL